VKEPPRITVIGESLVDVVVTPHGVRECAGGSPMNVAVGLARLQASVAFATSIGDDDRGKLLLDHLGRSGVALVEGSILHGQTSTSTAHVDAEGSAHYEFAIDWSLAGLGALPDTAIVHAGSIASYLLPGADDVEGFLAAAHARSVTTFDPNIRPSLIDSHRRVLDRVERVAAVTAVLKLSDEDAQWLYPERSADWVLSHLLDLGPALAILTRGGDGSVLRTRTLSVQVAAAPVTVADTIGAGDSFMSGIIHSIDRMLADSTDPSRVIDGTAFSASTLNYAARFAASCAGLTVTRIGADPPTLAELLNHMSDR